MNKRSDVIEYHRTVYKNFFARSRDVAVSLGYIAVLVLIIWQR